MAGANLEEYRRRMVGALDVLRKEFAGCGPAVHRPIC